MNKLINSLQHPLVKHLAHLRQNSDYRNEHKSVLIEGSKIIREVATGHQVKTLLVTDESKIPTGIKAETIAIVNDAIIKKISGMPSSEGVVAEVAMPPFSSLSKARYIVVLDHLNDPGNVGTVLRTALAFGWEGAFLIGEGCDPYNDKAIRAARGATFRMPIRKGSWSDFDKLVKSQKLVPIVADLEGTPVKEEKCLDGCALVLGNEAHGPSEEAIHRCKKVTIPMADGMESLNVAVAGGILMYLLRSSS